MSAPKAPRVDLAASIVRLVEATDELISDRRLYVDDRREIGNVVANVLIVMGWRSRDDALQEAGAALARRVRGPLG